MNKKRFFVVMFWIILVIFMFAILNIGHSACVMVNNEVFFTETLHIYSNGSVSYDVNGERIHSNNATYFWVENENDCKVLEEIFK